MAVVSRSRPIWKGALFVRHTVIVTVVLLLTFAMTFPTLAADDLTTHITFTPTIPPSIDEAALTFAADH